MKRWGMLCVGVLLFAGIASAQDVPTFEVFTGYSYVRMSVGIGTGLRTTNFNGASASVAYNLNNWLGVVGDFGGYTTGNFAGGGLQGSVITYLFGPKISFRRDKLTPYVQGLAGGARLFGGGPTINGFAFAGGGGLDWNATPHFGLRLIEADYLMTKLNFGGPSSFNTQHSLRVSTGFTFSF